jgi:hypothetical protein
MTPSAGRIQGSDCSRAMIEGAMCPCDAHLVQLYGVVSEEAAQPMTTRVCKGACMRAAPAFDTVERLKATDGQPPCNYSCIRTARSFQASAHHPYHTYMHCAACACAPGYRCRSLHTHRAANRRLVLAILVLAAVRRQTCKVHGML